MSHRPLRSLVELSRHHVRAFTTSSRASKTTLPPRPKLPDSELHHTYLKGSGPGGQKINKTNSAVQIIHLPTGVVVKSQATRSRSQNHKIAREILAEKIELLEKGTESRVAKKVELKSKRKASAVKKSKRKYKRLEEKKAVVAGDAGSEENEDGYELEISEAEAVEDATGEIGLIGKSNAGEAKGNS